MTQILLKRKILLAVHWFLSFFTDSGFPLTNKATGFCLVKYYDWCKPVRWTTGDRLLADWPPKCLGVQGKSLGSLISLYDCDENSELQKWECKNETVLALKGQELYIDLTADNTAVLSRTIGPNNHLTITGTSSGACSRTARGNVQNTFVLQNLELSLFRLDYCVFKWWSVSDMVLKGKLLEIQIKIIQLWSYQKYGNTIDKWCNNS